jgi:hypothetical protein
MLQFRLRIRRAGLHKVKAEFDAVEPDLDINSIFLRRKFEQKEGMVAKIERFITGEVLLTERKARGMVQKWKPHCHTLEKILEGEDLDEPGDFDLCDGGKEPEARVVGDSERKPSDTKSASVVFVTLPNKPRRTPGPPKRTKAEWAAAKEEQQHQFIRTRDLTLRQWYTEAHSHDPQVRLDAQVRLYIQFLIRDQRAQIQEYKQRRDKCKAASDISGLDNIRQKLPYALGRVAVTVRMATGEVELPKNMTEQATEWWEKGHSLAEVLGGAEWDWMKEFREPSSKKDDTTEAEEQGAEKEEEIVSDDDEADAGAEENGTSDNAEANAGAEEEIVSDDDEEGGVLLSDVLEPEE